MESACWLGPPPPVELDDFDPRAGISDHRLDQSARPPHPSSIRADIHAPQQALVRLLLFLATGKPGNSQNLSVTNCAKHHGTAQSVEKPSQGLGKLNLERAAEGFRALLEAL